MSTFRLCSFGGNKVFVYQNGRLVDLLEGTLSDPSLEERTGVSLQLVESAFPHLLVSSPEETDQLCLFRCPDLSTLEKEPLPRPIRIFKLPLPQVRGLVTEAALGNFLQTITNWL